MIGYIEVTLVVHGQVLRTMVQDGHVGIPLDIVYLRIFAHQIIHHTHNKVLHLGIAQVEYQLCAATPFHSIALGCFHYPVGVLLVEFTHAVGHLRLYPDAELHVVFLCIAQQALNAIGQLLAVHLPVAQR